MPKGDFWAVLAGKLQKTFPGAELPSLPNDPAEPTPLVDPELAAYRDNPVGFFEDILGVTPTPQIRCMLQALPGRVKMESGHKLGKSHGMAGIGLWWFYTRNPSVVICNGPTSRAVEDILWTEIRLLLARAKYPLTSYLSPKAPEMFDTPDHWMKGYTTSKGEAYQGRHRECMLFLFDEDEGIDPIFWVTTDTMYQPDGGHCWVVGCNPLTTSSQSFIESTATDLDGNPKWKLFVFSSLDHPNIKAELNGEPRPIRSAVSLGQVRQWVKDWTTAVDDPRDRQEGDVEWPPGSGKWRRPGPIFMARALGKRPETGVDTVWSKAAWDRALLPKTSTDELWRKGEEIVIGVDTALYGDDLTAFHVRCGPLSLHHEAHNGWGYEKSAGRLKELCAYWAWEYNKWAVPGVEMYPRLARDVKVVIELDGGYGAGVLSHRGDYDNWVGVTVGGASQVLDETTGDKKYANVRAQIWFETAEKARKGQMDLSRLDSEILGRMRQQLLTVLYEPKPDGSRKVEGKVDIKERLGRSPDDADSLNISHYNIPDWSPVVVSREEE